MDDGLHDMVDKNIKKDVMLNYLLCLWLGLGCTLSNDTTNNKQAQIVYQNDAQTINKYANANAWQYRDLNLKYLPNELKDHISVIAAQWWQEANWRCDLSSRYADGCAQFTPSTAKWASASFCRDLGRPDPHDPQWAYPCGVRYMTWLYKRIKIFNTVCDRWGFTLKAYNGGLGNVRKEQKETSRQGLDSGSLYDNIKVRIRAEWADKENDQYPIKILHKWMPKYLNAGYGGYNFCENNTYTY